MSYMRAWTLVKIMNKSFRGPLVEVDRGGAKGGAARLSALGQKVLRLYGAMIAQSEKATQKTWAQLETLLKT